MNRKIWGFILIMLSMTGKSFAQKYKYASWRANPTTRTEAIFNSQKDYIQHRHTAFLEKGTRIIFELCDINDYRNITNLDSIVRNVNKNISFLKDSLKDKVFESVRIDYVADNSYKNRRIRSTIHPYTSDMFVERKGELAKLKTEYDTVRIRIFPNVTIDSTSNYDHPNYPVQITVLINNYNEIATLPDDYNLNSIVDTLAKFTAPSIRRQKWSAWSYTTTAHVEYNQRHIVASAKLYYGLPKESTNYTYTPPIRHWNFHGSIGAALVQNKIAPFGEVGLQYKWPWVRGEKEHGFFKTFVSPVFIFDKHGDGTYHTYDSWFINLEGGARVDEEYLGVEVRGGSMGASYLLNPDGIIFKRTTGKLYFSMQLKHSITITPEIIFTDNFKSIFPGFTVKVF